MRILQVHKYLYPKAGAERYVFDVTQLLIEHGHTVGLWGTRENYHKISRDERIDQAVIYEDLLAHEVRFDTREGFWRDLEKAVHFVWSFEAAEKFRATLKRFKPDVVHIHNIYHHLTPSILRECRKFGVPVVMTVHDWSRVNPNYALYDHGAICERRGLRAIFHRCIQDSYAATALAVFSFALHALLNSYERTIRAYLAPTAFAGKKLRQAKIKAEKIHVVPYPLASTHALTQHRDAGQDFILFVGRISAEKGINILIAAAKELPQYNFVIAGTGPDEDSLKAEAVMHGVRNVEFIGFQKKDAVASLMRAARLIVVPSNFYDVSPYVVFEAQGLGKAVLASHIGGIPDLIRDGKTGFLVAPGSAKALSTRIASLMAHPRMLEEVGRRAHAAVIAERDPEKHYRDLMNVYEHIAIR